MQFYINVYKSDSMADSLKPKLRGTMMVAVAMKRDANYDNHLWRLSWMVDLIKHLPVFAKV